MPRILDRFLDKSSNRTCAGYPSHEALFYGLAREEAGAIRCLSAKIAGSVYQIGQIYRLTDDDIEELICDAVALTIQKIESGAYVFQGYNPATYAIEIAKNKVHNYRRSADKFSSEDIEQLTGYTENDDFISHADEELLESLLKQLDPNCRNLIRLKYLEERKDKEMIEQKLTQYSTVDALKNNRARCMKKLIELADTYRRNRRENP